MSEQNQVQPGQNQEDELEVEELEEASGGTLPGDTLDDNYGCNVNCPC